MSFEEKLRLLLENANITQKKLAKDLNVATSTMSGYVRGVSEPDFAMLKKIADYFSVSTDYLLDYSKSSDPNTPQSEFKAMESELLECFEVMPNDQKEVFINQTKAIAKYYISKKKKSRK